MRDLRQRRIAAGLTQKELAEIVGVRQHTISRIETGVSPGNAAVRWALDRALLDHESVDA